MLGTNAIFRRSALDSVAGIAYGSLTEDAFTGKLMIDKGWKGLYFRKDFEGIYISIYIYVCTITLCLCLCVCPKRYHISTPRTDFDEPLVKSGPKSLNL